MPIDTAFLIRCITTLESAFEQLRQRGPDDALYDIFRAASVKEFELVLEQSGSLLKKRLRPYFASNRQADRADLQGRLPARRQAWPHLGGCLQTLVRLSRQQERHRSRLRRKIRGDDAPSCCPTSSRTRGNWQG